MSSQSQTRIRVCSQRFVPRFLRINTLRATVAAAILATLFAFVGSIQTVCAQATPNNQESSDSLKQMSLEQLGDIQVTTASKEPEKFQRRLRLFL